MREKVLNAGLVRHRLRYVLLKTHFIRVAHLENPCPDQVPTFILEAFVPDRRHFHLDWPARKLELDVQLAIRSGKVVLANPNRRNNERQPRRADIKRVTIKFG